MIDIRTISDEISKLESSKASYPTCEKLADLYIVKDHLMKKQGNYEYARDGGSNYGMYERGGNSNYGRYENYGMMDDEMGMEMGRSPRMSMPSMR